jgi:hypothetical protein
MVALHGAEFFTAAFVALAGGANHPATLIFAGVWLESGNMNATEAHTMGLRDLLARSYWPWVGNAAVTVTDNATGAPVVGAVVEVHYGTKGAARPRSVEAIAAAVGGSDGRPWTAVTRKVTDAAGKISFSGWAGRSGAVPHTVEVKAAARQATAVVQLKGQALVEVAIGL